MMYLFQTERLACRRWVPEDLDSLYAVYSDEEGSRWVGDGTPITFDECEDWLKVTERNYLERGYGMFALDETATGQTIGFCGLVHPSNQVSPEVKYAFLRQYWGKGYASEAVPGLFDYGAKHHQLREIIATVAEENIASRRVLAKSGMVYSYTITESDGSRTHVYRWECS